MTSSHEALRDLLAFAAKESLAWREAEHDGPVAAPASHAALYQQLDVALTDRGIDAETVIRELAAGVRGGLHKNIGGRFFGWVMGGSLPSALAADWLTSAWDQNAGAFAVAPAACVAEEIAGRWLLELLGLPSECSFALVTGCQMAHVTCLAAARHHLLASRGWDVERQGLSGAPPVRILTSTEVHGTVPRATRLLGLGTDSIQRLPTDSAGRLSMPALAEALATNTAAPTIVLLQAGDLHMGAFDAFAALIPLAHEHGAWVHIDGAFGLWLAAQFTLSRPDRGDGLGRLLGHRRPQVAQRTLRLRLRLCASHAGAPRLVRLPPVLCGRKRDRPRSPGLDAGVVAPRPRLCHLRRTARARPRWGGWHRGPRLRRGPRAGHWPGHARRRRIGLGADLQPGHGALPRSVGAKRSRSRRIHRSRDVSHLRRRRSAVHQLHLARPPRDAGQRMQLANLARDVRRVLASAAVVLQRERAARLEARHAQR